MTATEKSCRGCGQRLSLAHFYRHSQMADGHLNFCKPCVKSRVGRHREANVERIREYDRDRASQPHRRVAMRQTTDSYSAQYPERKKANTALNNAIRDGRVTKPCACWACGSTRGVVGHHFDYAQPLLVSWLCQACHKQVHKMSDALESRAV